MNQPIGIFDSGVGGLSITCRIRKVLPNENLIYIADSNNAPYGEKSQAFIAHRCTKIIEFLILNQAKAIVIACNTATVLLISQLRTKYSLPIIGIEPGIKPAVKQTISGIIGVLTTEQTATSHSLDNLIKRFSAHTQIHIQPCPGLVEKVENMDFASAHTLSILNHYIQPLLDKGVDTLVLGCTHYAYLSPIIKDIVGLNVTLINPQTAIAKEVQRRLKHANLLTTSLQSGTEQFWSTGNKNQTHKIFNNLWGCHITLRQNNIE